MDTTTNQQISKSGRQSHKLFYSWDVANKLSKEPAKYTELLKKDEQSVKRLEELVAKESTDAECTFLMMELSLFFSNSAPDRKPEESVNTNNSKIKMGNSTEISYSDVTTAGYDKNKEDAAKYTTCLVACHVMHVLCAICIAIIILLYDLSLFSKKFPSLLNLILLVFTILLTLAATILKTFQILYKRSKRPPRSKEVATPISSTPIPITAQEPVPEAVNPDQAPTTETMGTAVEMDKPKTEHNNETSEGKSKQRESKIGKSKMEKKSERSGSGRKKSEKKEKSGREKDKKEKNSSRKSEKSKSRKTEKENEKSEDEKKKNRKDSEKSRRKSDKSKDKKKEDRKKSSSKK